MQGMSTSEAFQFQEFLETFDPEPRPALTAAIATCTAIAA